MPRTHRLVVRHVRIGGDAIAASPSYPAFDVTLVAGTALDADGQGDRIAIEDSPNEGLLIDFLPEPAFAMQALAGAGVLCGLSRRRRRRG